MLRKLLLALFALLACVAAAQNLQVQYDQLNRTMLRNSAKEAAAWVLGNCTTDFTYTSKDGRKYNRKAFMAGLRQQMAAVKGVAHSTIKIGKPKVAGNTLTVIATSDFEGTLIFDGKSLVLTDRSQTRDVWIKVGSAWKLRSIVQTKADTQMTQKQ